MSGDLAPDQVTIPAKRKFEVAYYNPKSHQDEGVQFDNWSIAAAFVQHLRAIQKLAPGMLIGRQDVIMYEQYVPVDPPMWRKVEV